MSAADRKTFAAFVLRSLEESRPQLYRARSGELVDRRRAVYRLVISPEQAGGLDLREVTAAAVVAANSDLGGCSLRWMAAIHRNTRHPHVHLVIAGMFDTRQGFARFDLTRPRLAAVKASVAREIARQRGERIPNPVEDSPSRPVDVQRDDQTRPTRFAIPGPGRISIHPPANATRLHTRLKKRLPLWSVPSTPLLQVRAAALRYASLIAKEAAEEARRHGWENAA